METLKLIIELVGVLCLIFLSASLSASEVAIFSLSRIQLRFLKENYATGYQRIKSLLADPGGVLVTILIMNEFMQVTIATCISELIFNLPAPSFLSNIPGIPDWFFQTFLGTAITTPILLILCEISPKVLAARMNQVIAPVFARFLTFLYRVFKPVRWLLQLSLRLLMFFFRTKLASNSGFAVDVDQITLKEEDVLFMLEQGVNEGTVTFEEINLVKKVFELDDTTAVELVHKIDSQNSLLVSQSLAEAFSLMKREKQYRIPVMSEDAKTVVGVLHSKDIIFYSNHKTSEMPSLVQVMRRPFFISTHVHISLLLKEFKQLKTHIAIVKDHEGRIRGFVTMKDILDALFTNPFQQSMGHEPSAG